MIRVVNPGRRGHSNPGDRDDPQALEHVRGARMFLIKSDQRPYLGSTAMALQLVESHHPSMDTAAVDSSWRMYYNAEFALQADVEDFSAVVEHEIWHLLRRHAERAEQIGVAQWSQYLWNLACDAEIHNDEKLYERVKKSLESKGSKPINAASLGCESGLMAEDYFRYLIENAEVHEHEDYIEVVIDTEKGKGKGQGAGSGEEEGEGEEEEEGQGAGSGEDEDEDGDEGGSPGSAGRGGKGGGGGGGGGEGQIIIRIPKRGKGKGGKGEPVDEYDPGGSAVTNIPQPWELPPTDEYMSRSRAETMRRDTVKRIFRHAALGRGNQPSGEELAWAEAEMSGRIDWRNEMRSAVSNAVYYVAGSFDYSRRKLSRRQAASEYIMAGLQHPVPEIAVVIDVSGSMYSAFREGGGNKYEAASSNYNLLEQAIAEVESIVQEFGQVGVSVFATDTTVAWAGKVFGPGQIKIPSEAGGTDIAVGMNAAYFSVPQPNVMIVLTDGATPWPDNEPPGVQVVVGIIGSSEEQIVEAGWKIPGWASVVYIV